MASRAARAASGHLVVGTGREWHTTRPAAANGAFLCAGPSLRLYDPSVSGGVGRTGIGRCGGWQRAQESRGPPLGRRRGASRLVPLGKLKRWRLQRRWLEPRGASGCGRQLATLGHGSARDKRWAATPAQRDGRVRDVHIRQYASFRQRTSPLASSPSCLLVLCLLARTVCSSSPPPSVLAHACARWASTGLKEQWSAAMAGADGGSPLLGHSDPSVG